MRRSWSSVLSSVTLGMLSGLGQITSPFGLLPDTWEETDPTLFKISFTSDFFFLYFPFSICDFYSTHPSHSHILLIFLSPFHCYFSAFLELSPSVSPPLLLSPHSSLPPPLFNSHLPLFPLYISFSSLSLPTFLVPPFQYNLSYIQGLYGPPNSCDNYFQWERKKRGN